MKDGEQSSVTLDELFGLLKNHIDPEWDNPELAIKKGINKAFRIYQEKGMPSSESAQEIIRCLREWIKKLSKM